jgi:SAM-dependent methyltransferase
VSEREAWASWYARNAARYAQVAEDLTQSVFVESTHPAITQEFDLFDRTLALAPGHRGLDLGCGAGARDVARLTRQGCEVDGLDGVAENIAEALARHPHLAGRLRVADLRAPLPYPDGSFDFAVCDSVVQHLAPEDVRHLLAEAARVLRPGGVLQLLFKVGSGELTITDPQYGDERRFTLHEPEQVEGWLEEAGIALVQEGKDGAPGGVVACMDHRRIPLAALWAVRGR